MTDHDATGFAPLRTAAQGSSSSSSSSRVRSPWKRVASSVWLRYGVSVVLILIIAVEDDLAREFVQPMITNLREGLTTTGASVGVIQRESLLATNRGVARGAARRVADARRRLRQLAL